MAVTLKQLEAFVAAARTGSFSAATELIHVSQPALTSMIKKLEEQLGLTLFERSSRGASLTPAGRELLPSIDRLISELNDTIANVLSERSPRGGMVSIACIPSVAAVYLPPLIAAFEKRHPAVRVEIKDAMPENRGIVDMLRAGEIDLGLASPSEDARDLQFHLLYEDELIALLPSDHQAGRTGRLSWEQLVGIPLIGMAYQSNVRLLVDKTFARIGVSKPPRAEVSLITTAVGMARAGLGVAILPSTAARTCNLDGLAILRIDEPVVHRPLGFLYPSIKTLSPAAKRFMQFVRETQAGA